MKTIRFEVLTGTVGILLLAIGLLLERRSDQLAGLMSRVSREQQLPSELREPDVKTVIDPLEGRQRVRFVWRDRVRGLSYAATLDSSTRRVLEFQELFIEYQPPWWWLRTGAWLLIAFSVVRAIVRLTR